MVFSECRKALVLHYNVTLRDWLTAQLRIRASFSSNHKWKPNQVWLAQTRFPAFRVLIAGSPYKRRVCLHVQNVNKCTGILKSLEMRKPISSSVYVKALNIRKSTSFVVQCRFWNSKCRIWAIWWVLRSLLVWRIDSSIFPYTCLYLEHTNRRAACMGTLCFDWFFGLPVSFAICKKDHFGFAFTTLNCNRSISNSRIRNLMSRWLYPPFNSILKTLM